MMKYFAVFFFVLLSSVFGNAQFGGGPDAQYGVDPSIQSIDEMQSTRNRRQYGGYGPAPAPPPTYGKSYGSYGPAPAPPPSYGKSYGSYGGPPPPVQPPTYGKYNSYGPAPPAPIPYGGSRYG